MLGIDCHESSSNTGADAGAVYESITQLGRSGWYAFAIPRPLFSTKPSLTLTRRLTQTALNLAEEWQLIPVNMENFTLPTFELADERRRKRLVLFLWPKVFEVSMESQRVGLQYYDVSSAEQPDPPDIAYSNFLLLRTHKVLSSSLKAAPELANHFPVSGSYMQMISTAKDISSQWMNDFKAQHGHSGE